MTFPLFEAWGTWNEIEIYDTKTSSKNKDRLMEKIEKSEILTAKGREIEEKEKEEKIKTMEKEVEKQGV